MDPKNPKTYVDQSVFVEDEEHGYHPIEFRMSSSGVAITRTEPVFKQEEKPRTIAQLGDPRPVVGLEASILVLSPCSAEQARQLAFALRKCARRMDEISKAHDWLEDE